MASMAPMAPMAPMDTKDGWRKDGRRYCNLDARFRYLAISHLLTSSSGVCP